MFMNTYNQGGGTSRPSNHLSKFLNDERRGSGVSMNSTLSLALISSCPKHLDRSPLAHALNESDEQRTPFLINDTSATQSCSCAFEAPKVPTYYYEDKKTFIAAIDLYNKESCDVELKTDVDTTTTTTATTTAAATTTVAASSTTGVSSGGTSDRKQRWESKGEIRACFQLCSICKDLGKAKSYNEQYFIDVLEIRKYRTILCKGCFGHILKEAVGTESNEIEERLKMFQGVEGDTEKEDGGGGCVVKKRNELS